MICHTPNLASALDILFLPPSPGGLALHKPTASELYFIISTSPISKVILSPSQTQCHLSEPSTSPFHLIQSITFQTEIRHTLRHSHTRTISHALTLFFLVPCPTFMYGLPSPGIPTGEQNGWPTDSVQKVLALPLLFFLPHSRLPLSHLS